MNPWIEHHGGPCPVAADVKVYVKLRGHGQSEEADYASNWDWHHDGGICDLIAYRLASPPAAVDECGHGETLAALEQRWADKPPARLARDMTVREHYAGLAMQAFCAAKDLAAVPTKTISAWAIEQADALLAALEKGDE